MGGGASKQKKRAAPPSPAETAPEAHSSESEPPPPPEPARVPEPAWPAQPAAPVPTAPADDLEDDATAAADALLQQHMQQDAARRQQPAAKRQEAAPEEAAPEALRGFDASALLMESEPAWAAAPPVPPPAAPAAPAPVERRPELGLKISIPKSDEQPASAQQPSPPTFTPTPPRTPTRPPLTPPQQLTGSVATGAAAACSDDAPAASPVAGSPAHLQAAIAALDEPLGDSLAREARLESARLAAEDEAALVEAEAAGGEAGGAAAASPQVLLLETDEYAPTPPSGSCHPPQPPAAAGFFPSADRLLLEPGDNEFCSPEGGASLGMMDSGGGGAAGWSNDGSEVPSPVGTGGAFERGGVGGGGAPAAAALLPARRGKLLAMCESWEDERLPLVALCRTELRGDLPADQQAAQILGDAFRARYATGATALRPDEVVELFGRLPPLSDHQFEGLVDQLVTAANGKQVTALMLETEDDVAAAPADAAEEEEESVW